jgi:hypothetical protein
MWYQERKGKGKDTTNPKFQMCCNNGKVQLPLLKQPPEVLRQLLFDQTSVESKKFQQNTRIYNSVFIHISWNEN